MCCTWIWPFVDEVYFLIGNAAKEDLEFSVVVRMWMIVIYCCHIMTALCFHRFIVTLPSPQPDHERSYVCSFMSPLVGFTIWLCVQCHCLCSGAPKGQTHLSSTKMVSFLCANRLHGSWAKHEFFGTEEPDLFKVRLAEISTSKELKEMPIC